MALFVRREATFLLLLVTIHCIKAQYGGGGYYPQPGGEYEGGGYGGNGYGYEEPPQPIKLKLNLNLPSITIKTRAMELPEVSARVDLGSNPKGQYGGGGGGGGYGGQDDYGSASKQQHNYYYPQGQPQPVYGGPGHYPAPAQWTPHGPAPPQHYGPPAPPQYGPSPYPHPSYHQHAPPPNKPYYQ